MYPTVARIPRGGVVCLLAGAGMLALVVTTNAQRAMHKPAPAVRVEVASVSSDAGRTGRPTDTDEVLDPDIIRVTRSPSFPGGSAPNGGSGGIAGGGGFPGTSQFFGFEPAEGFVPGFIDGQVGWVFLGDGTLEAHIDVDNPATGVQQLQLGRDPVLAPATFVGGISPSMGSFENTSATVSVDVFITGTGRSYNVRPQSTLVIVADVRFNRAFNRIEVLDDIDGDGNFLYEITGATWIPDQYVNLTIDLSALGAVTVSYNGVLIYTVIDTTFGTSVQNVLVRGTNGANDLDHADFDNLEVVGGIPPTGACCNSDGMSGCTVLNAIDCAAAGGTFLGNDTLCIDCPLGACCNIDGLDGCEITDPAVCAAIMDAFYLGDATLCDGCPVVPDTCGLGAGDCLVPHLGPGCDDIECCALVCDQIPFCCLPGFDWDITCSGPALDQFCTPDAACGVPGSGDCFTATPQGADDPFCDDNCGIDGTCPGCCALVCALDPFCCDMQAGFAGTWDAICVTEAMELCGCEAADMPQNNDCINAIEVFVGPAVEVSTFCGSPDGPDHDTCSGVFVTGLGVDVWFFYTATFDGALTITPTPAIDVVWETQLAVYEGTDCGALSDPPFACGDIGGSAVVDPVVNGVTYLIRLGGTSNGPTGNGTLELAAVPSACSSAANDCLTAVGTAGCSDLSCCAVVCLTNPSCCDVAWDQACADDAAAVCAPLVCALDTAAANLIEPELCGEDTTGGCNAIPDPPAFVPITSGAVIHGTAWADGATRDTDWYLLDVSAADDVDGDGMVDIHFNLLSELPVTTFLIDDQNNPPGCVDTDGDGAADDLLIVGTTSYSQSCFNVTQGVATMPAPGQYYVFAGPADAAGNAIFDGFPCPVAEGPAVFTNNYLLCVDVVDNGVLVSSPCSQAAPPCPWDCGGDNDGNVGIVDFLALLGQWTMVDTSCDFDGGGVSIVDFLELLANWGACP